MGRCLLPRLDLDEHVDQRDSGWRDSGNAAGLSQCAGADARQLFIHLAREAADLGVIEPVGDGALLGTLQSLDGFGLLVEVAGVLDFGLDGFQLVADFRRKAEIRG